MIDIQSLLDAISEANRNTRKDYHVSLGELITALGKVDPEAEINFGNPHSYRGYYADLALEPLDKPITVCLLIQDLNHVLDRELTGYKGGEFTMSADTPVWVAHYGCTGKAMLDINPNELTFTLKEIH
jgi:hypothetical protein